MPDVYIVIKLFDLSFAPLMGRDVASGVG